MKRTDLLTCDAEQLAEHFMKPNNGPESCISHRHTSEYDAALINLANAVKALQEKSKEYDVLIDRVGSLLPGGAR